MEEESKRAFKEKERERVVRDVAVIIIRAGCADATLSQGYTSKHNNISTHNNSNKQHQNTQLNTGQ